MTGREGALLLLVLNAGILNADCKSLRIPRILIAAGIALRIAVGIGENAFPETAVSFLSAFLLTAPVLLVTVFAEKLTRKTILGGGDVFLIFLLSLFFPWQISVFGVLGALAIGAVGILCAKAELPARKRFPFAGAIAGGFFLAALYGEQIMRFWSTNEIV